MRIPSVLQQPRPCHFPGDEEADPVRPVRLPQAGVGERVQGRQGAHLGDAQDQPRGAIQHRRRHQAQMGRGKN